VSFLVLPHLDIGEAAVIVDAGMDEVPARASETSGAIAGDATPAGNPKPSGFDQSSGALTRLMTSLQSFVSSPEFDFKQE
jgi:hypothetical protein